MRETRDANTIGRRISKQIVNSADWNCTYHYYYGGQRMIEMRDGNLQVLKQHVWGLTYVDELVQIAINQDPDNASAGAYTENVCERFFWALQDANFNVIGMVNSTGIFVERYEYTPYGQRTIFGREWLATDADNDGDVDLTDLSKLAFEWEKPGYAASTSDTSGNGIVDLADDSHLAFDWGDSWDLGDASLTRPRLESVRGRAGGAPLPVPTGLCDVGHQGLHLDKEFGLYYNRARYHHPRLGRFVQRDPAGYVDGMSLYEYVGSTPTSAVDPYGLRLNWIAKDWPRKMPLPKEARGSILHNFYVFASRFKEERKNLRAMETNLAGLRSVKSVKDHFAEHFAPGQRSYKFVARRMMGRELFACTYVLTRRPIGSKGPTFVGEGELYDKAVPIESWTVDINPCHIVLYIGHYLGTVWFDTYELDIATSEYVGVGEYGTPSYRNETRPIPAHRRPTFGAVTCYAPRILKAAERHGYHTLDTKIGQDETVWLPSQNRSINAMKARKRRAIQEASRLFKSAQTRAGELSSKNPCCREKGLGVTVDVIWGKP